MCTKNVMDLAIAGYENIKAKQYIGIFGHPIKHTLSPVIHDTLSRELKIDERYIPFHVENSLGEYVKRAYEQGILGLNITVPYKQEVMPYLVAVDEAARDIGAVNTLVRAEGGYKGYNTDMPGLAKALFSEGIELKGEKIIMLGAGGAARAVAYMCMKYGASVVYIVNRTYERAKKLADDMNSIFSEQLSNGCQGVIPVSVDTYKETIKKDSYLMIQCTSVGLHREDGLPFALGEEFYGMAKAGVDLIYNPAETPFIKKMKALGVKAINGLKMLLYQGILAYELWNGLVVEDALVKQVYTALSEAVYGTVKSDNIVLIGFMGAGKSTVGKALAQRNNLSFIDTDIYIEQKENMAISDIFEKKGEAYFRDLETRVLLELKQTMRHTVIATGGGLPLREENSKLLKEIGTVYYLKASADTIYNRVKRSTNRPLLQCEDPYGRVCEMLLMRGPVYEKNCHKIIVTDGKNIDEVIGQITCVE